MLIGNTMVSISLGLNTFTTQFKERRDCIEVQLAFGASRWEVIQPVFIESLRSAMLPTINMMSVMGLITIPGMMTGQILVCSKISTNYYVYD
jgi:putative ABC transport system permease protein